MSIKQAASAERMTVSCHLCDSSSQQTYLEARGFHVVECRDCGLRYVSPQPTDRELAEFYSTYDDGDQWRNGEEAFNAGIRDSILHHKPSGTVLDIGCGSGNFLRCMASAGFSTLGIEPSTTGSSYATSEHGINVFHGMVEDYVAGGAGTTFDVVSLLNVLEHFTRPKETLRKIRDLLNPDGLLVVVVPDARFHAYVGRFRRALSVSDPYWLEQPKSFLSGFKLPDHLCSFEPRTIRLFLERCGFRVTSLRHAPVVMNPGFHRNLAKVTIRYSSDLLRKITFGKFLFGYSTLAIARKKSS